MQRTGQDEQDLFVGRSVCHALHVGRDGQLPGAQLGAAARGADVGQEVAAVRLMQRSVGGVDRSRAWSTPFVLRVASQLVEGIQGGWPGGGSTTFGRCTALCSPGSAGRRQRPQTSSHLGVTKQAAAQLVDYLVAHGYLRREADPRDGRAKLLVLTERGEACTAAADQAATDVVQQWSSQLPPRRFEQMRDALHQIAVPGRLRPAW